MILIILWALQKINFILLKNIYFRTALMLSHFAVAIIHGTTLQFWPEYGHVPGRGGLSDHKGSPPWVKSTTCTPGRLQLNRSLNRWPNYLIFGCRSSASQNIKRCLCFLILQLEKMYKYKSHLSNRHYFAKRAHNT